MSFTGCLMLAREKFLSTIALIITSESTSNMKCSKPSSKANYTTLRVANISRISLNCGFVIFMDNATMTCTDSFQIITPTSARLEPTNIAPSKLLFNTTAVRGFHFIFHYFQPKPKYSSLNIVY